MNDPRTRKALDALADMLLTGPVVEPAVSAKRSAPAPQNRLRLSGGSSSDSDPSPAVVEALMLAHLPGYATPWISQYAQHAAQRSGPAALLRIEGEHVEIELFGKDAVSFRPGSGDSPSLAPSAGGSAAALDQLLADLTDHVAAWIVVINPVTDPAVQARLDDFARWTLLTGGDDAAVVGAYRLLKTLLQDRKSPGPRSGVGVMVMGCDEAAGAAAVDRIRRAAAAFLSIPVQLEGTWPKMTPIHRRFLGRFASAGPNRLWPQLRNFIHSIGSPESDTDERDSTRSLLSELELQALTSELDDDIESVVADELPRNPVLIDPPLGEQSFSSPFKSARQAGPISPDSIMPPDEPMIVAPPPPMTRATPTPSPAPVTRPVAIPPVPVGSGSGFYPSPTPTPVQHSSQPVFPAPSAPPPASHAPVFPPAKPTAAPGPTNLAGYLPGLSPLAARCPRHAAVQLAVDSFGHVHLLLAAIEQPVTPAIRTLLEARQWAGEHRSLLALTHPSKTFDPQSEPLIHLFTDQPRLAADLAFAGPSDRRPLRLHLLKPVAFAGNTIYIHEELN
jgi:hypothetical protein